MPIKIHSSKNIIYHVESIAENLFGLTYTNCEVSFIAIVAITIIVGFKLIYIYISFSSVFNE